jgi:hypothetical protein
MAKFVCPRCLYETGVKCNLKKHLSRKELCLPGYSNMRPRTILYLAETNNELLLHEITENGGAVAADAEARYAERISKLEADIRQLRKREAFRGVQNNISTTNIATQNNTNMNMNMNMNIVININAFGRESLGHITGEHIRGLVRMGVYGSIPNLLSEIHFNDAVPENKNIKITNERSRFAQIYDGDSFVKYPKDYLFRDLIHKSVDIIDDAYQEDGAKKPVCVKKFERAYDAERESVCKDLAKRIECMIMNSMRRDR